jgi:hypothetical protein
VLQEAVGNLSACYLESVYPAYDWSLFGGLTSELISVHTCSRQVIALDELERPK